MRTRENTERALLVYTGGVIEGLDNLKNPINIEIEIEDEIVWFPEKWQAAIELMKNLSEFTEM